MKVLKSKKGNKIFKAFYGAIKWLTAITSLLFLFVGLTSLANLIEAFIWLGLAVIFALLFYIIRNFSPFICKTIEIHEHEIILKAHSKESRLKFADISRLAISRGPFFRVIAKDGKSIQFGNEFEDIKILIDMIHQKNHSILKDEEWKFLIKKMEKAEADDRVLHRFMFEWKILAVPIFLSIIIAIHNFSTLEMKSFVEYSSNLFLRYSLIPTFIITAFFVKLFSLKIISSEKRILQLSIMFIVCYHFNLFYFNLHLKNWYFISIDSKQTKKIWWSDLRYNCVECPHALRAKDQIMTHTHGAVELISLPKRDRSLATQENAAKNNTLLTVKLSSGETKKIKLEEVEGKLK